jgi:hypothetical protein
MNIGARFAVLLSVALSAAACSAPVVTQDIVAPGGVQADRALEGVWDVRRADGTLEAMVHFTRDTVDATAGESRFVGYYELVPHDATLWRLTLHFDTAESEGVNVQLPSGYTEGMVVLLTSAGVMYAMEDAGAWTRWERMDMVAEQGAP